MSARGAPSVSSTDRKPTIRFGGIQSEIGMDSKQAVQAATGSKLSVCFASARGGNSTRSKQAVQFGSIQKGADSNQTVYLDIA